VFSSGAVYTSATTYSSSVSPDSFSYSAILKISQSVSDAVSEISSAIVSTAQTIKSIIVQTSGNQITAKAFSDIVPMTQIGDDLIYNATGAIINTKYGISISKAEYENDEIASLVKIERA
jgi:predicted regulator of Ras-like GTPase activity (Roadblock/LC7/MglB family)